jgi:hypothetical protein
MGQYSQATAIGGGWKNCDFRSSEAHHVGISSEKDRRSSESAMGEGARAEGGIGIGVGRFVRLP